jgi:hypothetical protein
VSAVRREEMSSDASCITRPTVAIMFPSQALVSFGFDPRSIVGISVGWRDLYDFHDDGQSIVDQPATIPDGDYWFRAVADPFRALSS